MSIYSIDWERLVRVFSALLTPAIGIITTYIAVQQYKTNRRQHRLALFDKRMAVFDSTMNLIASVLRDARVDWDQLIQLLRQTKEHELLFGAEIGIYINDVFKKGLELHTRAFVGGQPNIEKRTELLEWFSGQSKVATEKFLRYIDFREP